MRIGVIGIGRLGLCLALNLDRAGYQTVGYDIDDEQIRRIQSGKIVTREPYVDELLQKSTLELSNCLQDTVSKTDLLFVTVHTGSAPNGEYEDGNVYSVAEQLQSLGVQDAPKSLVINCNVNPGTTQRLQEKLAPYNYHVSFNPEWVAQGSIVQDQVSPDLVVIGASNDAECEKIESIYQAMCTNEPRCYRMDPLSAEITKLGLNVFLANKITFANMVGDLCRSSGADENAVLRAIGEDPRVGTKFFAYGFGYGGPCLPNDTKAFIQNARKYGIEADLVKATEAYNDFHLDFQVHEFVANTPKDENVRIGPVSYKGGVDSIENSQQLAYAVKIAKQGYRVTIVDTRNVINQVRQQYGDLFEYEVQ